MPANEYQFFTDWEIEAPRHLVYDILSKGGELPRWWPEVYLKATLEPAPDGGDIGTKVHLHTKGWLPYTLRWTAETTRADRPNEFELRATGDFDGRGIWTFTQKGAVTHAHFDWKLRADKPLIRYLSFALKPMFSWNHKWAMERGRFRIDEEIARRKAMGATG